MNGKFIFIGGVGRTGKSITKKILSKSDEVISFNFEHRFIIDPDGIIDFLISSKAWSPYILDKKINRLDKLLQKLGKPQFLKNLIGRIIRSNNFIKSKFNANSYHNWNLETHFPNYKLHVTKLIENLEEFRFKGNWVGANDFTYDDNKNSWFNDSGVELSAKLFNELDQILND